MANVVIGCDINNGNDSNFQNTVASKLEKNGHSVEKLTIGPNYFASYSYSQGGKNPKGKIGIYLIAAGLTSVCDLYDGNTGFKYAYFGIRGDIGNGIASMSDFKSKGIHKDHHGDCTSKSCNSFDGKTYPQINEITKSKCQCVYGGTPDEMADNLIKAMGGETDSDSDDGGNTSGGTIKEAIQKLLTHWDGEVECYIRGDEVHINKIREPEKYHIGILQEGVNVFSESVSLTDVNSNTPNILEVEWTGGIIEMRDENAIKRFGEIPSQITAVKKETVQTKTTEKDYSKKSTDANGTDDAGTGTDGDTNKIELSESSTTKTTVSETPIDNYKDALEFAQLEWNKLKRDNGRQLELQTLGSTVWKSGDWVKVVLPSFSLNGYMYIIRTSQGLDDGDWTCNMTLVDYPTGWGKEEIEQSSDEEEDDSSDDSSTDDADTDDGATE